MLFSCLLSLETCTGRPSPFHTITHGGLSYHMVGFHRMPQPQAQASMDLPDDETIVRVEY